MGTQIHRTPWISYISVWKVGRKDSSKEAFRTETGTKELGFRINGGRWIEYRRKPAHQQGTKSNDNVLWNINANPFTAKSVCTLTIIRFQKQSPFSPATASWLITHFFTNALEEKTIVLILFRRESSSSVNSVAYLWPEQAESAFFVVLYAPTFRRFLHFFTYFGTIISGRAARNLCLHVFFCGALVRNLLRVVKNQQ